jgi:acyl-coenzyme A thioesterase PaaI-like protein
MIYQTLTTANHPIEEIHSLISLNDGVNIYPHVCHGGVVTTIFDEVMGFLLRPNKDREAKVSRKEERVPLSVSTVTAELDVRYMNSILTPQTVWATSKFRK